MLRATRSLFVVLLVLASGLFAVGGAQTAYAGEDTPHVIENADLTIILEGQEISEAKVIEKDGKLLVEAGPIFSALGNSYRYDPEQGAIIVKRSQDQVEMRLDVNDGTVSANGKALGRLPDFNLIDGEQMLLTPNAIAILSGTQARPDAMKGILRFDLDPRLKVAIGFELYIEGLRVTPLNPEPRSVGPVLLIPLRPVADELGHLVKVSDDGRVVSVRRAQDSVLITLDMSTGLVEVNGRPRGVTPDFTYIDPDTLLLPASAIETLTGSHIYIPPGTDRIEITLDERLSGAIEAGDRIDDLAAQTPFTVERLNFNLGSDTINDAELYFRSGRYDARIRMETPDFPDTANELEPSRLTLDWRRIDGLEGSIWDVSTNKRELDSLGIRRIRGVSASKIIDDGRWSVAAGSPSSGARQISEDQSRLEYSGFAAGVRYADKGGWEAGLAVKADENEDVAVILSGITGRLGQNRSEDLSWQASVDLGVFEGPVRTQNVDIRGSLSVRWEATNNLDIDLFGDYSGAEFLRSTLDQEEATRLAEAKRDELLEQNATGFTTDEEEDQFLPDIRLRGQDQASFGVAALYRSERDLGPLKSPAVGLRVQRNQTGVFVGSEDAQSVTTFGASASARIFESGPSINLDYQRYIQEPSSGKTVEGENLTVRGYQTFKYATIRGQYLQTRQDDTATEERADVTINLRSLDYSIENNYSFSVSPTLVTGWSNGEFTSRAGLVGRIDSGTLLGERTKMDAHFGILQSLSGYEDQDDLDAYLTVGLQRQINRNLALRAGYRDNFSGNSYFGLSLSGAYDFAPKREYKAPEPDTGVLKGQVFLDENMDGIRQPEEPGLARAIVRLQGTRFALRSGRDGYYTIQNLSQGLYSVTVDPRSLPLGWAVAEDAKLKASVSDGRITEVAIPIVQHGQIRGVAFIDSDGDQEFASGESRSEGTIIELTNVETGKTQTTYAVSFGQYAFDALPPGTYLIGKAGADAESRLQVTLSREEGMMQVLNVPLVPDAKKPSRHAEQDPTDTSADLQES